MRGLDPRIHRYSKKVRAWMDCRVKPGNDTWELAGLRDRIMRYRRLIRAAGSGYSGFITFKHHLT
jgi:hypothetical protein